MRFSAFVAVAAIAAPALAQDHGAHAGMAPAVAELSPISSSVAVVAVAPESAAAPKKAPVSYAPISQINDGQIQAPTATSSPAAPPAPASPSAPASPASPSSSAPPATTAAPALPSDSTLTNTKTNTGTRTLSVSSAPAPAPPAPAISNASRPPPAVQTGAAAIMNAASGLSFAAFVAFVLA